MVRGMGDSERAGRASEWGGLMTSPNFAHETPLTSSLLPFRIPKFDFFFFLLGAVTGSW